MSATAPSSATWIRWETYCRYHAVYVAANGGFWTYCSRFVRKEGVREQLAELPPGRAKCACCKSRLRLPYLVPAKLMNIWNDVHSAREVQS